MVKAGNFVFSVWALHWCSSPGEGAPPREKALAEREKWISWNNWNNPLVLRTPPETCVPIWRRGSGHRQGWNGPPCQPIMWHSSSSSSMKANSEAGTQLMRLIPLPPRWKPNASYGWMPLSLGWNTLDLYSADYPPKPATPGRGWMPRKNEVPGILVK